MLNKKFIKNNLSVAFILALTFMISACGNNNSNNEKEPTLPTTTLTYEESLERMERESIKKESFESLKESIKESQKIEEESIAESVSMHVAELADILEEESKYRETRDEYINSKREEMKNLNMDEIIKAYEESRDKETTTKEEVTNEN